METATRRRVDGAGHLAAENNLLTLESGFAVNAAEKSALVYGWSVFS